MIRKCVRSAPLFGIILLTATLVPNNVFAVITQLEVPFTSQAPEGNWNQPWQDACEETAISMVHEYYTGNRTDTLDPLLAKKVILDAYTIKTNHFGYSLDETAETMVELVNLFYPWEARVVERPSIATMTAELDAGRPIILPAHGTELQNPYFLTPLLDYHVIVLKGYDSTTKEFIAHDPGTKFGRDFRYAYATIEAAMHDFEPGNMPRARKVAIFTSPTITERSAYTDGDADGMSKALELAYQTSLTNPDTDSDGFPDGVEMLAGYPPNSNSYTPFNHLLIKPISRPEVYVLLKGEKAHIPDPATFIRSGYRWQDIRLVRDDIFAYIATIPF